ncbi:hypothetical protein CesoFtcFv8_011349 [Champsocephalus esox]|uniref:Uncharacterized protein n=1 Tax=Champsocephalus esox TaxID=159716 RepID=A0AAN8C072_9TELE|nr:hypothetical protein CesoFtcFv8_011349 [Champsocephalus esox]
MRSAGQGFKGTTGMRRRSAAWSREGTTGTHMRSTGWSRKGTSVTHMRSAGRSHKSDIPAGSKEHTAGDTHDVCLGFSKQL